MTISIIGIGLIGGSIGLELKRIDPKSKVFGIDHNEAHLAAAKELHIIDGSLTLEEGVKQADLIILATPINSSATLLAYLLDHCSASAVIFDVGSLKEPICRQIAKHPKRSQFVAAHPIAGTEFSGPSAAHIGLFKNKVNIICDDHLSAAAALKVVLGLFEKMGARNIMMDSNLHDQHITYVSHLSHITSFALSLTVQALEKKQQNIFNMAGSGFSSTVRLAKSSAEMWVPIFNENKENMIAAIDAYIVQLKELKKLIQENDAQSLSRKIKKANKIKNSLPK